MATNLLQEFSPVSTESWEEQIRKDLKGADYAKKLIWQTEEGLAVKPYYRAEDIAGLEYLDVAPGEFPYTRGTRPTGGWRIREEVDAADADDAARAAAHAVAAGAEEIAFLNVVIKNASDLEILLAGLPGVPIHFQNADESLIRLLMRKPNSTPISTGWTPFTNLELAAEVVIAAAPSFMPFTIHSDNFEESGATAVQEVGFSLAAGIDFLAEMQARNIDIHRAAASLTFSFAIGANYFFEIAKLRAFRTLWARAIESFGGTPTAAKARIHARTSRWNKTIYDPHVNILRATTEAMSAAIGGADSISVAPFDECYKAPDEASRRLARNTQILLQREARLSRVADPGGGSYALEVITDFIARAGWKIMQEIETAGGFHKAGAEGPIRNALERSLAARNSAVTFRRRIFTGTNKYANPSEKALDRIEASRQTSGQRGARRYEQIRLRTERHAARTGRSPRVLLAEYGDLKTRSARSSFAADFFACAGFETVKHQFDRAEEIRSSDADMVVLCSSDAEYPALATAVAAKMTALGQKIPLIVAGNPDCAEPLKAAGIADFVHLRTNPIEFLTRWQQRLGIED